MSNLAPRLTRSLLRSAAASALMLGAFSTSAFTAGADAQIESNGFSISIIKVVSENGTSWTKIEDGVISLPVKVKIGMPDFNVNWYGVRQAGAPAGQYFVQASPGVPQVEFSDSYLGSTSKMTAAGRQQVINACNANLGSGRGIHETHNMLTGVGVELRASFLGGELFHNADKANALGTQHKVMATVPVNVKCQGVPEAPPNGYAAATPSFAANGIHLRFMTTAHYPTRPNPGTKCRLTHAKVRLETTQAGPVKFKLWTKVGNEAAQSQFVETLSQFVGPGKYEASFVKPIPVTKTTNVQAMAEDKTNPIGQSTGWKQVTVHCTGAGGGGYAGTPGQHNPDGLPSAGAKPPKRAIHGVIGDLTNGPHPIHGASRAPLRVRPFRTAPAHGRSAAVERFQRRKPHLN